MRDRTAAEGPLAISDTCGSPSSARCAHQLALPGTPGPSSSPPAPRQAYPLKPCLPLSLLTLDAWHLPAGGANACCRNGVERGLVE